jgi:hypothetical protein
MTLFSLFGIHLLGQIPRIVITNTKDMIIFVVSMYIAKISSHLLKKKKNLRTLFQPPEYRRPVTVATPADVGIPTFEQAWLIDRIQQNEN